MTEVKSSMFKDLSHDPKTNTLTATYANGSVHRYEGVDAKKHAELMAADSVGKHFNQHIKPHLKSV